MTDENVLKIGGDRHGARFALKRRFSVGGDLDGDGVSDLAMGKPGCTTGVICGGRFGPSLVLHCCICFDGGG